MDPQMAPDLRACCFAFGVPSGKQDRLSARNLLDQIKMTIRSLRGAIAMVDGELSSTAPIATLHGTGRGRVFAIDQR